MKNHIIKAFNWILNIKGHIISSDFCENITSETCRHKTEGSKTAKEEIKKVQYEQHITNSEAAHYSIPRNKIQYCSLNTIYAILC